MVGPMGISTPICWRTVVALADAADKQPILMRLDPASRAKVMMALLGLVVLGAALVLMVWVGGRYMRRIARERPKPTPLHSDDWAKKPLAPGEPESGDDASR